MKILVVADSESTYIWDYYDEKRFEDVELIISCGDLKSSYLSYLVTRINVPVFYVPGNHDQKYDTDPPEGCDDIDGKLVVYKGIRILGFGGSMKYKMASHQYTEKEMQRRIAKLKHKLFFSKGFDILVTHAPSKGLGDGKDLCHTGFQCFNDLIDKYSPKLFLHGHQHLNYGRIERYMQYKNTKIVNGFEYCIIDYPN